MKKILVLLLCTLPMMASAQELAKKGKSVKDIMGNDSTCMMTEGDLNKDGRSDLVIFKAPKLAIYFASAEGGYEQWKVYDKLLPTDEGDGTLMIDLNLSISERGALKIEVQSMASMGTSYISNRNYTYRYQNGDFYKIGEEELSLSRMTGEEETISTNYLTHKQQVVKANAFDDNAKPKETWKNIPKKPLRKLGEDVLEY